MHSSVGDNPIQVRVFTFLVDGVAHSKTLPHGPETISAHRDHRLNLEFRAWLESEMPGFMAENRIRSITFVDEVRPKASVGLEFSTLSKGEAFSPPRARSEQLE